MKSKRLFRKVAEVEIRGTRKFVVKDYLVEANVITTNANFKKFFVGLVEKKVSGGILTISRLQKASRDEDIWDSFNGPATRLLVSMTHFLKLLKRQSRDKTRGLLASGRPDIITHIIGEDGNPWVVDANWVKDHWAVKAFQIWSQRIWGKGNWVLSC